MTDASNKRRRLTRREALQGAIAMVGGSIAASQLAPLARAMADAGQAAPRFFSAPLFAVLEGTVDAVIPTTDTPGALDAGVHWFIDTMLADWANAESRANLVRAVEHIDERSRRSAGRSFVELDAGQRHELLEDIDREAYEEPEDDPASFRRLKDMILFGYYSSEIGASVELRYNPIPGPSTGCVPLEDIGRAWYKHGGF